MGIVSAVVVALACLVPPSVARGDTVEGKQAEAARLTDQLATQASRVVDADRRLRQAQGRLADVQESLRQAENGVRVATARQEEARRRLAGQAVDAYTHGGSVSVLGRRLRARSNLAVYDAYLGLVAGMDRSAVEGMRGARQDLDARRTVLASALGRARADAADIDSERASLQSAEDAQRANLSSVQGELATLVAAEQARRAAAAAARITAARVPIAAVGPAPAAPAGAASKAAPALAPSAAGDPFACIRQLESGNNYSSPGGGAYQFLDSTWHSLGYSGSAQDAPPAVQDAAARQLQARDGWKAWTTAPLCGLV
jgi:hypothetical protein